MPNLPAGGPPPVHSSTTRPRASLAAGVALAAALLAACSGGAIGGAVGDGGTRSGGTSSGGTSGGTSNEAVVTVSPGSRTMTAGTTSTFTCTVTGTVDPSCRWTVLEGASGGAVTPTGVYTAPASAGTYHVVATSRAAPERSTSATILVTSSPESCTAACPAPGSGVTWDCRKRFIYGLDWAWGERGADFGGIAAWNKPGVKAASASFDARMRP